MMKIGLICSLAGAWIPMLVLGLLKPTIAFKQSCDNDFWSYSHITRQIPFGEVIGAFVFCFLSEVFGRKFSIVALNLPIIVSCGLIQFFCNTTFFKFAHYTTAAAFGGAMTILPIYIGELAEKKSRGILISFMLSIRVIGAYIGPLLLTIAGDDIGLSVINYGSTILCLTTSIIFLINARETPSYYIKKNHIELAKESLNKIRSLKVNVDHELNQIIKKTGDTEDDNETVMVCLGSSGCLKAFIIMVTVVFFQGASGLLSIYSYHSPSVVDIQYSPGTRVISAIFVLGSSLLFAILVDRIGRVKCLLLSFTILFVSLLIISILIAMKESTIMDYLIAIMLLIVVCGYNMGAGPVPSVLIGELFPMNCKMLLSATIITFSVIVQFIAIFCVYIKIKTYILLVLSMTCCLFALLTIKLFYFETKGKSLSDIQLILYRKLNNVH